VWQLNGWLRLLTCQLLVEGEGATQWPRAVTESKSRGLDDVLSLVCDGLKLG